MRFDMKAGELFSRHRDNPENPRNDISVTEATGVKTLMRTKSIGPRV